jgi:large subunit ribosomal protein L17
MIELVDFNEIYGKGKGEAREAGKRTRRAGSRKKTQEKTEAAEAAPAKPTASETKEEPAK